MRQLKTELETKESENETLRGNVNELVKVLGKIELVKSESAPVADNNKKSKNKKAAVVPAKTAYKFFCDTVPNKDTLKKSELQELWKEADPKIRENYTALAAADKSRFQGEMEAYNGEQKALEMYYEKKKQEQAMAFFEAHLEAQAALEKAQSEDKNGKKKKVAKDPDAPSRPTSSYMFFAKEMRPAAVKKNPDAKLTEISKILGEIWKGLDKTKGGKGGAKKFEDMAAVDRERYAKEMEVYNGMLAERKQIEETEKQARLTQEKKEAMELMESQSVQIQNISTAENMSVISDISGSKAAKKTKDPNAPKRALTAYNFFVSENRESIKAKMPESATNAEVFTEVGKKWKALSDKNKGKYNKMSAKDQERYAKEMEKYNANKPSSK